MQRWKTYSPFLCLCAVSHSDGLSAAGMSPLQAVKGAHLQGQRRPYCQWRTKNAGQKKKEEGRRCRCGRRVIIVPVRGSTQGPKSLLRP